MNPRPKSFPLVLLAVLALAGAALLGCGGDDGAGADSDPQELLEETFASDANVDSGVLDLSLDAVTEGEEGGSVTASLSGPFDSEGEDALPLLDLAAALAVTGGSDEIDFEGGLTITSDAAFVTSDGTAYQVDDPTFQTFKQVYAESATSQDAEAEQGSAVFEQLGIDPSTWLTEVTNEGTEEIEGEETVHISGTADVGQIVEDAQGIAAQTGGGGEVDPEEIARLQESVTAAEVDVYTGADDKILRRLELVLEIDDPSGSGPVSLELALGISGVNEDQEISAPADAQPIEELVPGGLGALGAGSIPGLDGGAAPGAGGGGGGDLGGGGDVGGDFSNPEYLDCVAEAETSAEITACADLL